MCQSWLIPKKLSEWTLDRKILQAADTGIGMCINKTALLKSKSGEIITDKGKQLDRWVEHNSEVYSHENADNQSAFDAIDHLSLMTELDEQRGLCTGLNPPLHILNLDTNAGLQVLNSHSISAFQIWWQSIQHQQTWCKDHDKNSHSQRWCSQCISQRGWPSSLMHTTSSASLWAWRKPRSSNTCTPMHNYLGNTAWGCSPVSVPRIHIHTLPVTRCRAIQIQSNLY